MLVDGLPVSHTVFAGNRQDSTTVQEVIADLRGRFGLGRFVFVGDRGRKSEGSVAALERVRETTWQACGGADGKAKQNGERSRSSTRHWSYCPRELLLERKQANC